MSNQINVQPQQSVQVAPRQTNTEVSVSSSVPSSKIKDNTPIVVSEKNTVNQNNTSKTYTKEQVKDLAKKLNEAIGPLSTFVQFGVDKHNVFYVAVIDKKTDKVLSRFPAAQAPYLLQKIKEPIGIIFDTKG